MLRKFVFRVLRVTSSVTFWSRGTDESFLNTCGKDQRFYRHSGISFEKSMRSKGTLFIFKKSSCFRNDVPMILRANNFRH